MGTFQKYKAIQSLNFKHFEIAGAKIWNGKYQQIVRFITLIES
jgi:hypothetical protein